MASSSSAKRVRIYIAEQDKAGRKPLREAPLELLQDNGAACATVFRVQAGFGAHSRKRMARLATSGPTRSSLNTPSSVRYLRESSL